MNRSAIAPSKGIKDPPTRAAGENHRFARSAATAILWLGVCAVVAVVYQPVLSARALWIDDEKYLFENPMLMQPSFEHAARALGEVLQSSTVEGYYEPLTLLSLMADVGTGGSRENLYPFHRTSFILHIACTLLVMVLVYSLFNNRWVAAVAGLLFGLHPITVESIAWIWERKTPLSMLFVLASLITYVRFAKRHNWVAYLFSLVFFVLALMAKPTVTPLPVLLLLLNIWPLGRLRWAGAQGQNNSARTTLPAERTQPKPREAGSILASLGRMLRSPACLEVLPFFVIAGVSACITVISTAQNATVTLPGQFPATSLPFRISYLIFFYIGKVLWPVRLSCVYILPKPLSATNPIYLAAMLGVVVLIAAMVMVRRRAPAIPIGLLVFFFALLPTLGFIQYSWVVASDKYAYFPSIGILLILCWVLMVYCGPWMRSRARETSDGPSEHAGTAPSMSIARTALVAGFVLVAATLEARTTRSYLGAWQDTKGMNEYMLRITPDSAILRNNLAFSLIKDGHKEAGLEQYRIALALQPSDSDALYNLGLEFTREGKTTEAIQYLQQAVSFDPHHYEAHNNLGIAYAQARRFDDAAQEFQRAIEIHPRYAKGYENLATLLMNLNRMEEAVAAYRMALQYDDHRALSHRNLAVALGRLNRLEESAAEYQAALQLEKNPDFACELGDVLIKQGKPREAATAYEEALRINPNHARAQQRLAAMHSK